MSPSTSPALSLGRTLKILGAPITTRKIMPPIHTASDNRCRNLKIVIIVSPENPLCSLLRLLSGQASPRPPPVKGGGIITIFLDFPSPCGRGLRGGEFHLPQGEGG